MRDPYFLQTVLNLRGFKYSVNPLQDNSPANCIPLARNNMTEDASANARFGSAYSFLGNNTSYATMGGVPALGSGDFCIEFWMRPRLARDYQAPFGNWVNGSTGTYTPFLFADGRFMFMWITGGTGTSSNITAPAGTIVLNETAHWAIAKSGTTIRLFKNGIVRQTGTCDANINFVGNLFIGSNPNINTDTFNGTIEDLKITVGAAKYTSNFEVPTQVTAPDRKAYPPYLTGTGKIAGNVKVKGIPLVGVECTLFSEYDNLPIDKTMTDVTGRFEFTGLNSNELFYVVVKQNDTSWEHIVSSRRNPA